MKISDSIIFTTAELNKILELLNFDELRRDGRIELTQKSDDTLKKENAQISYCWHYDDTTDVIPFCAVIHIEERYKGLSEPVVIKIELTPAELIDVITEYYSWMSIPYKAIAITNCTKQDDKGRVSGVEDFGEITVSIQKLQEKKKKKVLVSEKN
ncbi:MAG: hypothetical protein J1F35_01015 [Erysipelotrichales bacterium]|nr:hypothetical protein [Erysipelotrichales bacterium]